MKLNPIMITINWMEGWVNNPHIYIVGAEMPKHEHEDMPAWEKRDGIHVSVQGDFVRFFHTYGQPTHGFGGARFAGTFKDGAKFEYRGAWSSRAGCVNELFPELMVVDVHFRPQGIAGHIRAEALIEWRRQHPECDWGLAWLTETSGEKCLRPTRNGGQFKNPPYKGSTVEHLEF